MTGPQPGMPEAMARFRSDLDAAVSRGRRAAAEAMERNRVCRDGTRELTERVKQQTVAPTELELTAERCRDSATGFRISQRLPVADLPTGAQLLAASETPAADPLRRRFTSPRPDDDDEDFSQEHILY